MAVIGVLCASGRAGGPVNGAVSLTLKGAVTYRGRAHEAAARDRRDIQLDLLCRDGRWQQEVWGWMGELPGQEHVGALAAGSESGGRVRLRIVLPINGNAARPASLGGGAMYELDLRRHGNGLVGTFRGTCVGTNRPEVLRRTAEEWARPAPWGGWEPARMDRVLDEYVADGDVSGEAVGLIAPLPRVAAGFQRAERGEHPRLFFRKADLPALRREAATADGRRMLAAVRSRLDAAKRYGFGYRREGAPALHESLWAAGYGLLYQLTGDRDAVAWSRRWCLEAMYGPAARGGGQWQAEQLLGLAACYDLFHDAWDGDFRDVVMVYLERNARQVATLLRGRNPLGLGEGVSFGPEMQCGWPGDEADLRFVRWRAAAGAAALAIAGDAVRGFRDAPPAPLDRAPRVAPARDFEPPFGTPVVPFTDDAMPAEWLINGPFYGSGGGDVLAELGGRAAARPGPGDRVRHRGVELDFRRFSLERQTGFAAGKREVPLGRHKPYVIDPRYCGLAWTWNERDGGYARAAEVRAAAARGGVTPTQPVIHLYTVVHNDRPRVVQARPNWGCQSHGAAMWLNGRRMVDGDLAALSEGFYPLLVELPITGENAPQAPRLAEYDEDDWRRDAAVHREAAEAYRASDGAMPGMERYARAIARSVRRFCLARVGPTGWADGADRAWRGGRKRRADYAETLKLVLPFLDAWRNVTGEDIAAETHLCGLVPLGLLCDGRAFHQADLFDLAMPLALGFADDKYLPAAKAFLRKRDGLGVSQPWEALLVLRHYPFAAAPAAAADVTAPAAADERYGVHFFRSRWGVGDWLGIVQLARDWPAAGGIRPGTFALNGAGRDWISGLGNAVHVAGAAPARPAEPTGAEVRPGETLVVSTRLDEWRGGGGAKLPIVVDRSVAMDFSGVCGAPVLIAVADTVRGAGRRGLTWQMALGPLGPGATAEVDDAPPAASGAAGVRTFRAVPAGGDGGEAMWLAGTAVAEDVRHIHLADAAAGAAGYRPRRKASLARATALRLTTYDPEALYKEMQRQLKEGLSSAGIADDEQRSRAEAAVAERVLADMRRGDGHDGGKTFVVVMTIQAGPAPLVQVAGAGGATTKVRIGHRILSLEGGRIVLGVAETPQTRPGRALASQPATAPARATQPAAAPSPASRPAGAEEEAEK